MEFQNVLSCLLQRVFQRTGPEHTPALMKMRQSLTRSPAGPIQAAFTLPVSTVEKDWTHHYWPALLHLSSSPMTAFVHCSQNVCEISKRIHPPLHWGKQFHLENHICSKMQAISSERIWSSWSPSPPSAFSIHLPAVSSLCLWLLLEGGSTKADENSAPSQEAYE